MRRVDKVQPGQCCDAHAHYVQGNRTLTSHVSEFQELTNRTQHVWDSLNTSKEILGIGQMRQRSILIGHLSQSSILIGHLSQRSIWLVTWANGEHLIGPLSQ